MDRSGPWLLLRWGLGLHFIVAGGFSVLAWPDTVAFNAILAGPRFAALASGVAVSFGLLGGLSLVSGRYARVGALLLLLFLLPAALRHALAAREAGALLELLGGAQNDLAAGLHGLARRGQLANMIKNLGLSAVVAFIALRGVAPALPATVRRGRAANQRGSAGGA